MAPALASTSVAARVVTAADGIAAMAVAAGTVAGITASL